MTGTKPIPSEESMIACLRSGNQQDFSKLYDVYSPMLMGILSKMVDRDAAKDLLQKTFIYAWKNRSLYNAESGRVITWLIKIARQAAGKQNLFQKSNLTTLPVYDSVKEYSEDHHQWVFESVFYSGESIQEVSKKIDIPEESLKLMLKSAVQKLKLTTTK